MLEMLSELPIGTIAIIVAVVTGIIFSIIKKMLKLAVLILSCGVLLFVIFKLASGYFGW